MSAADTLHANVAPTADRRRAGRTAVAPSLTSLLRNPAAPVAPEIDFDARWAPRDKLAPPRGIGLAVALCAPFWAGFGALLYSFIR